MVLSCLSCWSSSSSLEDSEQEHSCNKKQEEIENCTSFDWDFDQQVAVFDRNNPSFVSSFVPACSNGKSFESSFDNQAFVFDRDNPGPVLMHEDNVFDQDNPYPKKDGSESTFDSIIHLKKHEEGPFDRDNSSTVLTKRRNSKYLFPIVTNQIDFEEFNTKDALNCTQQDFLDCFDHVYLGTNNMVFFPDFDLIKRFVSLIVIILTSSTQVFPTVFGMFLLPESLTEIILVVLIRVPFRVMEGVLLIEMIPVILI